MDAPTDLDTNYRILGTSRPSTLRRIFGAETSTLAAARWAARVAQPFNDFMWREVQQGISPDQARRNYHDATLNAFVEAFIPLVGIAGFRGVTRAP